jgi:hypothetical protein
LADATIVPVSARVARQAEIDFAIGASGGEFVRNVANRCAEVGVTPLDWHLAAKLGADGVQEVGDEMIHAFTRADDPLQDISRLLLIEPALEQELAAGDDCGEGIPKIVPEDSEESVPGSVEAIHEFPDRLSECPINGFVEPNDVIQIGSRRVRGGARLEPEPHHARPQDGKLRNHLLHRHSLLRPPGAMHLGHGLDAIQSPSRSVIDAVYGRMTLGAEVAGHRVEQLAQMIAELNDVDVVIG